MYAAGRADDRRFYRGDSALNAAASQCATETKGIIDNARGCADLAKALQLAIPGDGLAGP